MRIMATECATDIKFWGAHQIMNFSPIGQSQRMTQSGVLGAIGNTPLVSLKNIFKDLAFSLYCKLEMLNPGGSVKDRSAANMIKNAFADGRIDRDTVIIESTSGNMGVGLAQICSHFGVKLIVVVDAKTSSANIQILKAYGAEVCMIDKVDALTGQLLPARLQKVQELLKFYSNSFWPNQYGNLLNAAAHAATMHEIVESLGTAPDYLFCAISTCGTIRGCADYIQRYKYKTKVIGIDAEGSAIFGDKSINRLIPGHGAGIKPDLFQESSIKEHVLVSDKDCVWGCRKLLASEGIFAGGSTGGIVAAINKMASNFKDGETCVLIAPDRGERYLDTIYNDKWVLDNRLA
jgi:cysteine synthase A